LIEKYNYQPSRLGVEIVVPRRTPNDRADIIVYKDNEHKHPYIVIECKKDGITDSNLDKPSSKLLATPILFARHLLGLWRETQEDFLMWPGMRRPNELIM